MSNVTLNVLFGVDPQRGFCPKHEKIPGTGELPVPDGDQIFEPINQLYKGLYLDTMSLWDFGLSCDQHPSQTDHFKKWPVHCVAGTPGAEFHPALERFLATAPVTVFEKGIGTKDDGYSAVEGLEQLEQRPFGEVYPIRTTSNIGFYVWGLATDHCVKATVLDMLKLGYRVVLLTDAIRAVDKKPGDGERAIKEMVAAGAICKTTKDIISGWRLTT